MFTRSICVASIKIASISPLTENPNSNCTINFTKSISFVCVPNQISFQIWSPSPFFVLQDCVMVILILLKEAGIGVILVEESFVLLYFFVPAIISAIQFALLFCKNKNFAEISCSYFAIFGEDCSFLSVTILFYIFCFFSRSWSNFYLQFRFHHLPVLKLVFLFENLSKFLNQSFTVFCFFLGIF